MERELLLERLILQRIHTMSDDDIRMGIEKCWMFYWKTHNQHWKVCATAFGKELMNRVGK